MFAERVRDCLVARGRARRRSRRPRPPAVRRSAGGTRWDRGPTLECNRSAPPNSCACCAAGFAMNLESLPPPNSVQREFTSAFHCCSANSRHSSVPHRGRGARRAPRPTCGSTRPRRERTAARGERRAERERRPEIGHHVEAAIHRALDGAAPVRAREREVAVQLTVRKRTARAERRGVAAGRARSRGDSPSRCPRRGCSASSRGPSRPWEAADPTRAAT